MAAVIRTMYEVTSTINEMYEVKKKDKYIYSTAEICQWCTDNNVFFNMNKTVVRTGNISAFRKIQGKFLRCENRTPAAKKAIKKAAKKAQKQASAAQLVLQPTVPQVAFNTLYSQNEQFQKELEVVKRQLQRIEQNQENEREANDVIVAEERLKSNNDSN